LPIDVDGRIEVTEAGESQVATAKIDIGSSATTLATGASGLKRRRLIVRNTKSASEIVVYIGDANVTTSTGFPLYQWDEFEMDVDVDAVVKAIRAPGAADGEVRIMEIE
jgi:hypothetical protein